MESRIGSTNGGQGAAGRGTPQRRRRKDSEQPGARFFLPKAGSSPEVPLLGEEMSTEGDALVEALKSGQVFFVLRVFRAEAQQNGGYPVITKQPIVNSKTA